MDDKIKELKIEDTICGVVIDSGQLCTDPCDTIISIDEYGAVIPLCEKHAKTLFSTPISYMAQELGESKRFFAIQLKIESFDDIVPQPVKENENE
jgi:hypothetical protein